MKLIQYISSIHIYILKTSVCIVYIYKTSVCIVYIYIKQVYIYKYKCIAYILYIENQYSVSHFLKFTIINQSIFFFISLVYKLSHNNGLLHIKRNLF